MIDDQLALLCAHRSNIGRYRRLLKTELTKFERRFIERRLSEERAAIEKLSASTFPLAFKTPNTAIGNTTALQTASAQG
ncbi:hypothetical protein [Bradyrhizobium sp. BR 10289]|uniref:hypothetical protein n=1 Tax=Bradyrhizobium sp. BR 10289 TaxID=2749993 RepID=UPI001C65048D|nr:hypothetical protein [Bradyrhizobium sp. BR 10289]MBW7970394.1 hypothetical protein [Bradyrhizobium sp. BR 10289]